MVGMLKPGIKVTQFLFAYVQTALRLLGLEINKVYQFGFSAQHQVKN